MTDEEINSPVVLSTSYDAIPVACRTQVVARALSVVHTGHSICYYPNKGLGDGPTRALHKKFCSP
jgi:hypothetical protein